MKIPHGKMLIELHCLVEKILFKVPSQSFTNEYNRTNSLSGKEEKKKWLIYEN